MGSTPDLDPNKYFDAFNRHGFAFQHSVLRTAERIFGAGGSTWIFQASEFPVATPRRSTRIDLLLTSEDTLHYLVVECKRTNPALSEWCFARAPAVRRNRSQEYLFVEAAQARNSRLYSSGACMTGRWPFYHRALVIKTNKKGDTHSGSSDRDAIETAAGQVCTGVNGLVEYLAGPGLPSKEAALRVIFPAIFTTARLITIEDDLSDADIGTGKLDPTGRTVTERPWVFYQYHMSPDLKHSQGSWYHAIGLPEYLDLAYVRTIAIVNSASIERFLLEFDSGDFRGAQPIGEEPGKRG